VTTVNEIPRLNRWFKTILGSDATLVSSAPGGIWRAVVPKGRTGNAVVYEYVASLDDTPGNFGDRVWSRNRYIVKALVEGNNDAAAQTIADRIDAVLERRSGGVADVTIDYCRRVRPFYFLEAPVDSDKVFIHMGGEYEVAATYAG
jgi:hypothetical protein